jgi:hypothetical protein
VYSNSGSIFSGVLYLNLINKLELVNITGLYKLLGLEILGIGSFQATGPSFRIQDKAG